MSQPEGAHTDDLIFPVIYFPELDTDINENEWSLELDRLFVESPKRKKLYLTITEHPQSVYKFRFQSQANIYLHGRTKTKGKTRTCPTVQLCVDDPSIAEYQDKKYYIRCTLYQEESTPDDLDYISPHRLQCRLGNVFTNETEMFLCHKKSENIYEFTLEKFMIFSTARRNWNNMMEYKLKEQLCQDQQLSSPDELSERQKFRIESKVHQYSKKSHYKVRLRFDAFQQNDDATFNHVAGPVFSESIANGLCPYIKRVCNKNHSRNGRSDMTLVVTEVKPSDKILISELISEDNEDDSTIWKKEIKVENEMIQEVHTVTFQMPNYGGSNYSGNNIECQIQLERFSDGARSNKMTFFYTNSMNTLLASRT